MGWNRCSRKGSFSVDVKGTSCPLNGRVRFSREITTTYDEKNSLLEEACAFIGRWFVSDGAELFRVRLSIDEGLQNAFSHGNSRDPAKRIRLALFESSDGWGVTITDEGSGFRPEDLPDPTAPDGVWQEHGRGLMIMCLYMDEVSYFDSGRTLRLLKRNGGKGATRSNEADAGPYM